MNLSTVKWARETKPNPENLGLFIYVCIALCTIGAHNIELRANQRPNCMLHGSETRPVKKRERDGTSAG